MLFDSYFAGLLATFLSSSAKVATQDHSLRVAHSILSAHPLLDMHIDLPVLARVKYRDNLTSFPYDSNVYGHVDLPRLRKGHVGGFFSIAYVPCPADMNRADAKGNEENFLDPSWAVRDTLEQIDVTHNLAAFFPKVNRILSLHSRLPWNC